VIEQYLSGSINQSLERVRQLAQIVQGQYPREYDGLRQLCLTRLDGIRRELYQLSRESVVDPNLQTSRRVRQMKRIAEQLRATESVGVFALSRARSDDDFLNRLITDVCRDIAYPVIVPTISQMSQDYFHIYPDFNLLCVPLIEGRFLLHLPDIYHELCHPLHRSLNADLPRLAPYHNAFKYSLFATVEHFNNEMVEAERLRSPKGKLFHLQLWRNCWIKYWMEEFFCDLFGVLTAGPAFVWAHFHLCVERGGDPFDTPMNFSSSHPADAARMKAMLKMLTAMGFPREVEAISAAWRNFEHVTGAAPIPEYAHCYAEAILCEVVASVHEGVSKIGVTIAAAGAMTRTVTLLNEAWTQFWLDPPNYALWESKTVEALRVASTGTKVA
jgi:hypothetical protein